MEENLDFLLEKKDDKGDYRVFEDIISRKAYHIYLNNDVDHTDDYLEIYEVIRKAQEDDEINIYMNSYGGFLDTAVAFSRVMDNCKARIIGHLDVACSAMGMIALHCDEIILGKHSYFQAHNFKGGSAGSGREMRDKQKFDDRYFPNLVKEVYKDFLTEQELEDLPNDANIWLTADEVAVRLKKLGKLSKKGYQGKEDKLK
jgi:ATP-dependent protease ClpP protease subunit